MSETTITAAGRPREQRVDDAVRAAVLSLLAQRGYQRTTIAAVAERAGVGRGALYRRWRSKAEMVFGVVVHGLELADPPQHGSLAGDLEALGERIALLSDSEIAHAALLGLTAELDTDAGLREALDARLWAVERRYLAVILQRAADQGELRPGVDPELVRRLLVGAIAIAPIYGGGPTAAREAAAIVAAGLLARYAPQRAGLSARQLADQRSGSAIALFGRATYVASTMGGGQPDARELLGATLPHLLPERIVEVASAQASCPVAVYVLDLDGSCALRLAGGVDHFPDRIRAPVGVGPEISPEAMPQLRTLVIDRVGPSTLWPLVVRDRVMGFLLARDRPAADLDAFAGQAALALELASGYTDALHAVRRHKDTQPAAEIQQNLLPPRLARVDRADVAGGVLPGYEVGGDFFDYAGNADGVWLVVADATGKGNSAAALSSLAIGALRAARRAGAGLQEAARRADEAILTLDMHRYLTAVLGSWDPKAYRLRWINCGHPSPLVLRADGRIDALEGERTYPLGVRFAERRFPVLNAQVDPGDRLLLYSDGVSERRTADGGRIGEDGLRAILTELGPCSAASTVRGLQDAVLKASPEALRDDATLLVVAPHD